MISGLPRPPTTGSASCAPASARLRISGIGLISVFSGEKPETIVPGLMARGKGRAAIVSAAFARSAAGSASRRMSASLRMTDFSSERESVIATLGASRPSFAGPRFADWAPCTDDGE